MKTFIITEAQMQEIGGRVNAITLSGIKAESCEHVAGIFAVLGAVFKAGMEAPAVNEDESNVVHLDQHKTPPA